MNCPYCNGEMRVGLAFCPQCGRRVGAAAVAAEQKREGGPSWALFALVIILAGLAFGGYEAYIYYKTGQFRDEGRRAYRRISSVQYLAYRKMLETGAATYNINGEKPALENCIKSLEYLVGKNPKGTGHERMKLAECYLYNNDPVSARKQMEDAAGWEPKNPDVLTAWAKILYVTNTLYKPENPDLYEQAAAKASEALSLKPDHPKALMYLGLSQDKLQRYAEAETNLIKALKYIPQGDVSNDGLEMAAALADARKGRSDVYGAIRALEDSLKIYTNQFNAVVDLANLYLQKKEYRKCSDYSNIAVQMAEQQNLASRLAEVNKLAEDCTSVLQLHSIKSCVTQRRELDGEYILVYGELNMLLKEIPAAAAAVDETTGEPTNAPNEALDDLLDRVRRLQEKYRPLRCDYDFKEHFKISLAVFQAQMETLAQAVTALKRIVESHHPDEDAKFRLQRMIALLQDNNEKIMGYWAFEEKELNFNSLFKRDDATEPETTKPKNLKVP